MCLSAEAVIMLLFKGDQSTSKNALLPKKNKLIPIQTYNNVPYHTVSNYYCNYGYENYIITMCIGMNCTLMLLYCCDITYQIQKSI